MVPAILARHDPDDSGLTAGGLPWTTNSRLPGRKPYMKKFRTGGPTRLNSRDGMSGAACPAWCTPRTSPPLVVRGEDAVDLRDQIRRAEGNLS